MSSISGNNSRGKYGELSQSEDMGASLVAPSPEEVAKPASAVVRTRDMIYCSWPFGWTLIARLCLLRIVYCDVLRAAECGIYRVLSNVNLLVPTLTVYISILLLFPYLIYVCYNLTYAWIPSCLADAKLFGYNIK
jgi:hypothetical protein